MGKVIRWKYLFCILFSLRNEKIKKQAIKYGKNNQGIFNNIFTIAKKEKPKTEYIIDSSKDMYRLLLLKLSKQINIKVIHLTKVPQGFVFSMAKPKMSLPKVFRMSFRWSVENYLMNRMGTTLFDKNSFYHLKYEDLVTNPDNILNDLSEKLSLSFSPINQQKISSTQMHGIAGNIARYNNKTFTPDFEWKEKMSFGVKKIIGALTFFMAKKLKY